MAAASGRPGHRSPRSRWPGPARAARLGFYPFADFSPELAAIRWARERGSGGRLLRPAAGRPAVERRSGPHPGGSTAERAAESARPTAPDRVRGRASAPPGPAATATTCGTAASRCWPRAAPRRRSAGPPSASAGRCAATPSPRAAYRPGTWRARRTCGGRSPRAAADGRRVAAVIGAFHAPALTGPRAEARAAAPRPALRPTGRRPRRRRDRCRRRAAVVTSLVPYAFDLLDSRSGYPAGIRDPRWQQAVFEAGGDPEQLHDAAARAITDVCRELRAAGHTAGTGEAAETLRMACDLARLRGLPAPGPGRGAGGGDDRLGQGEPLGRGRALARALEAVLVGTARGRIAPGTPRSGLGPSVEAELAALRLPVPGRPAPRETPARPAPLPARRPPRGPPAAPRGVRRRATASRRGGRHRRRRRAHHPVAAVLDPGRSRPARPGRRPRRDRGPGRRGHAAARPSAGSRRTAGPPAARSSTGLRGGGPVRPARAGRRAPRRRRRGAARRRHPPRTPHRTRPVGRPAPAAICPAPRPRAGGRPPNSPPTSWRRRSGPCPAWPAAIEPEDAAALVALAARAGDHRLGLRLDDALGDLARTGSPLDPGRRAGRPGPAGPRRRRHPRRPGRRLDRHRPPDRTARRGLTRRLAGLLSRLPARCSSRRRPRSTRCSTGSTADRPGFPGPAAGPARRLRHARPAGRDRLLDTVTERLGDRPRPVARRLARRCSPSGRPRTRPGAPGGRRPWALSVAGARRRDGVRRRRWSRTRCTNRRRPGQGPGRRFPRPSTSPRHRPALAASPPPTAGGCSSAGRARQLPAGRPPVRARARRAVRRRPGRGLRRPGRGRRPGSGRRTGRVLPHGPRVGRGTGRAVRRGGPRGGPGPGRRPGPCRRAGRARPRDGPPLGRPADLRAVARRRHARAATGPAAPARAPAGRRTGQGAGHPYAPGPDRAGHTAADPPSGRPARPAAHAAGQPGARAAGVRRPRGGRPGAAGVQHPLPQGGGLAADPGGRRVRRRWRLPSSGRP